MKNYSVKNSPLLITVINVVLAQIAHTASNLKISQPPLSNVIAANCSALNVKMMTTRGRDAIFFKIALGLSGEFIEQRRNVR